MVGDGVLVFTDEDTGFLITGGAGGGLGASKTAAAPTATGLAVGLSDLLGAKDEIEFVLLHEVSVIRLL